MSIEQIKNLKESPEIKLNEGVDELSAVTDVSFNRALEMDNWRVSEDGERCEKRDGVADVIASGLTEYVTNGTFEAWSSATDADDWTESLTGSSTINREATEVYAGTYSLKFDIDASKSLVKETQAVTLVAGASYVLSFWYKGSESSGDLLHLSLVDSGNNKWLNGSGNWNNIDSYDGGFVVSSTTTWTQKSLAFTAHASYTAYNLAVRSCPHGTGNASCQVYVDNVSILQVNPFADIFGYHTYYDSTPAFCQLAIDENEVWRKIGSAAWISIHTWASTLSHPVKVLDIQGKQIIVTEIENIMILPDGTKVQLGITAPSTVPTMAAEYLELDLDEDCASFNSQWTDADAGNGVSSQVTFDSKSTFKFLTAAGSGDIAMRRASLAQIGSDFTFETSIYFDEMGIVGDTDHFELQIYNGRICLRVRVDAQGMYVYDGTNWKAIEGRRRRRKRRVIKRRRGDEVEFDDWEEDVDEEWVTRACPISIKDAWHTLKLAVNSSDPDNEVVEVFVDDKSMGEHSCANKDTTNAGRIELAAYGDSTATVVYTDYIKLKSADIKTGNLKGTYRYAFTYARSGNYPNESNPIKAVVGGETFTGSGLDDLTTGGTYTGDEDMTIRVQIDGTTPDTFKWSEDGGETWAAETMPLTLTTYLPYGIELTWAAITGHTSGDYWEFTCDSLTVNPVNQKVEITSIPTSSDAQVDQRKIYRSQPGGAAYYLVATLNDNTTTSFKDNISDALLGAPLAEDNDVAPLGKYFEWWDGRLWIADDDDNLVYYSKTWVPDAFDTTDRYVSARRGISNDKIMNMIEYRGLFYIFKRHGITYVRKKLTGGYGTYHSLKTNGNVAPWSLIEAYGFLMYLSFKGWEVFNGEESFSLRFSKPVRTTLQSVDKTNADKVISAQLFSKDEIWLSIPDRTGGLSAVTVVLNFLKSAFYTFSFSKTPSSLSEALDSNEEIQLYMGTRDGYLGTCESGTQDFGTNITATIRTGWWKFPIYQNFPMTEVEYEAPTGNTLTFNQYVNFDKDVQRTKALAGATPTSTDQSIRLPIKNEIKSAIRGKYLSTEFTNAENVGSDIKLNWFKQFYAPMPRKGEIKGN